MWSNILLRAYYFLKHQNKEKSLKASTSVEVEEVFLV